MTISTLSTSDEASDNLPAPPALEKTAYTSWIRRVGARVIDFVPILSIWSIGVAVMILASDEICEESDYGYWGYCTTTPSSLVVEAASFAALALSIAFGVWNRCYLQGVTGSSIGKSAMKFKVVNEKSWQPIGFGHAILRALAHVVDSLVVFVGYLWPLWSRKRQTLADEIMRTVCVPLPKPRSSAEPLRPGMDNQMHGRWAPHEKRNAKHRLDEAADRMARELLKIATSPEPEAVKLKAVRDALDRAGLRTKKQVDVDAQLWEQVIAGIAAIEREIRPGQAAQQHQRD